jgi:hypothetical protein
MVKTSGRTLDKLIPKTLSGWGVIAIVAAFVLLFVGAMFSLRRPRPVISVIDATPPEDA